MDRVIIYVVQTLTEHLDIYKHQTTSGITINTYGCDFFIFRIELQQFTATLESKLLGYRLEKDGREGET